MTTTQNAHNFFYNSEKRSEYARVKTHFAMRGGKLCYYSYSTPIAWIDTDKNGDDVLVFRQKYEHYSATTCKHMAELKHACPYTMYRYFDWGTDFDYIKRFSNLQLKKDRAELYEFAQAYYAYTTEIGKTGVAVFDDGTYEKELEKLINVADSIEKQRLASKNKHTDEERAEMREKRKAKLQEKISKLIESGDKLELLKQTFAYGNNNDLLKKYKTMLLADGVFYDGWKHRFSYIWIDGDTCYTSQRIRVPKAEVAEMCRKYVAHEKMLGGKIGCYTIVEKNNDFVKCGCHIVPTWNVVALCEKLVEKN